MALSTMAHAPWTILSSRAAIEWPLPTIRLWYVRPTGWLRPIRSPVDLSMEVLEIPPEVLLVVLPCYPVDTGGGFAFERVERRPERVDVDMVEKRGEPLLLPLPCGFPYAVQRLGHALPGLGPVRALLIRVPLGLSPWLPRLRYR